MGLEAASFIDDLVTTNPVAGDNVSQGDDHLRLIKTILKASFPNIAFARYLEQPRADLASATSPNLWATTTNYVNITGTTTITDFADAAASGQVRIVRFDGALTLTHGASAIDLPGSANITTAAGDHAIFVSQGTTLHRCIAYFRKNGKALVETTITAEGLGALIEGKHTIAVGPSLGMYPSASNGATISNYRGFSTLAFDENDSVEFLIPMPKSYNLGTMSFRVWCVIDTGASASQTVTWSLAARSLTHSDGITSVSYGSAQSVTCTIDANDDLSVSSESSSITSATTPVDNDIMAFKLTRTTPGSVGASVQVHLLGIHVYITLDEGDDS